MNFKGGGERTPISAIPKDIAEVMDEVDIEKTWDYLEKTFRVNKKEWKADFEMMYSKSSREYSKLELFVRYGKEHFEPALNKLLHRSPQHCTWIMLIRFIVVEKIKKVEEEKGRIAKMFGRKSSYKTR